MKIKAARPVPRIAFQKKIKFKNLKVRGSQLVFKR